jgi:pilus assembly protein Flp/PilA
VRSISVKTLSTTPNGGLSARLHDERGATAVEYALMAGLIALAIIVAVTLLGTNLSAFFEDVANNPPFASTD